MEEEKHIIKKAVVELYLPSAQNSFEIQNKSLSYFKEHIVPMIEKIVARLSVGDRIVRIDKLEFDFKNFSYNEPNEAALMKLEQSMEEEIIRLVRAETNDNPLKTEVKKISKGKRDEELFLHLLLNGTLPWWTDAGTPIRIGELAEKVMQQPGPLFLKELRRALASPAVRKRISIQLPFAGVEKIIRATCGQPEELIRIVEALAAFLPAGITAPYNFRSVLYKHALRHSQGSDVTIARYVATLIREELDFSFVEKLYKISLEKGNKDSDEIFHKGPELENKPVANDPAELSFIIKKTLSRNDRYFNGRIRELFVAGDKKLFFISPAGKEGKQPAKDEALLKKEKLKGKETGTENSEEDSQVPEGKRDQHPGNKTEKELFQQRRQALKLKQEEQLKLKQEKETREQEKNKDAAAKDKSKNKPGPEDREDEGTDENENMPEQERKHLKGRLKKQNKTASEKNSSEPGEEPGETRKDNKTEDAGKEKNPLEPDMDDDPLELYAADPAEDLLVSNAGIIIVTPFLPTFFKALDLYDGKAFVSQDAVERAVCLLHYLSTGSAENMQEHDMVLNKIICGMEISEPVALQFELSEKEKEECHGLLEAVAGNWPALKGTSGEGMRDAFFTREGILEKHANGWNLKIERITIDILLDRLTWGISIVKMPWSREMIFTNW